MLGRKNVSCKAPLEILAVMKQFGIAICDKNFFIDDEAFRNIVEVVDYQALLKKRNTNRIG